MTEPTLPAEEYWGRPASVASMPAGRGVLPFEEWLLAEGVRRAGGPDRVRRVHVVGVGAGRELAAVRAAAPDAAIEAWDVAGPMVEACRLHVAETGLANVAVARAAAADLRPAQGAADLVVCLNAVLCYPRPAGERGRSFAALGALLRPGGALVGLVQQRFGRPDMAAFFAAQGAAAAVHLPVGDAGDRRNRRAGAALWVHHYTSSELSGLLAAAGLARCDVRSLRRWAAATGHALPRWSHNPLLLAATRS